MLSQMFFIGTNSVDLLMLFFCYHHWSQKSFIKDPMPKRKKRRFLSLDNSEIEKRIE